MAQSIVPLVIVLLASSLALSNANGIDKANNVFCQDKADGLYPDTSDSHSFYHCSNSLTYHKQCPANLVFNPAKNRCDWDVVNSAFCQDKADGLYPDPLDSHSFFQCSNSLTYHKQCPANLVFNPAISVCDWPVVNSAFCQDKADGMYADPSDSHSFYHCSNSLTYHKQCPANLVFNPAKNICDWDVPHDDATTTTQATTKPLVNSVFCQDKADGLYPDPLDSHSFYHCSNSLTYHKQCPANLVFNPAISVCDWPGNVAAATTQATTKSVVNSVFCQDKADGLYPDPLDSHSFYHCSNSLTYHKQCPANLVFNPAISVCDWPGNVAAATTQATTKSVVNSVFCQDKADGLYPDPLDSHSFYHCSNSLTYHKQCPANLVFNPAISVCDWPGNVAAATTQATTKSVVNSAFCQDKADGLYPDPSDSHSFYHCSNSLTYHKQCPANLVFNPAISVCDWPGNVAAATTQATTKSLVNSAFCQDKADGLYPDPSDSHSFYHCSNSLTYHKQCPANLVFNPAISVCDWPVVNSGFCQDKADGLYPDPSDSHSFYHCSNSLTYHKQCPANLVFNPAISVCDWPGNVAAATTQATTKSLVNSGFCQDKADGLYPDPSDSHSFYHCSNSLTYHKQCPANLVFNPAISVCDWPVVNSGFCQDKADGMYADPSDSHSFYHCSNSLTYHKQCPANLVFNTAKNRCDWDVSHDDATTTTKGTTKPQYVVDFCKAKVDGMFADPGNTNAFYHCSNHYTYYKLCQQGLVFNQRLGACVWPSQGV
ncbi:chondroitin proteoglycan-2-like isoform X3 [Lampetra planeri]